MSTRSPSSTATLPPEKENHRRSRRSRTMVIGVSRGSAAMPPYGVHTPSFSRKTPEPTTDAQRPPTGLVLSQGPRVAVRSWRRDRFQVPLPLAPQGLAASEPYRAVRYTEQTLDLLPDDGRAHSPVLVAHHRIDAVGDPQAARVIGRGYTQIVNRGENLQVLRRL